jgi:hypothetical protein
MLHVEACRQRACENYANLVNRDEMVSAKNVQLVYVLGIGACGDDTGHHLFRREEFIEKKPQIVALLHSNEEGEPILQGWDIQANVAYILLIPRSTKSKPMFIVRYEALQIEALAE